MPSQERDDLQSELRDCCRSALVKYREKTIRITEANLMREEIREMSYRMWSMFAVFLVAPISYYFGTAPVGSTADYFWWGVCVLALIAGCDTYVKREQLKKKLKAHSTAAAPQATR